MQKIYLMAIFALLWTASCKKKASEEEQIQAFIAKKGWQMQKTSEGLYYRIDSTGSGGSPTVNQLVRVRYKGYLLDESVFDQSMEYGIQIGLQNVIQGWQIGIPKFQKGGGGVLIMPSSLGYGASGQGSIPGEAPLVFDVNLVDFR
jgi:FKBP-type peptidyl-prolyl cis-trans isomerase